MWGDYFYTLQSPCPQVVNFVITKFMDARLRKDWAAVQEVLTTQAKKQLTQDFLFFDAPILRYEVVGCKPANSAVFSVEVKVYPLVSGKPPTHYWPETITVEQQDQQFRIAAVKRGQLM